MWKEFKEFATKGNVMDLAIGVIIGGGFQKIVTSLVDDIIMPFVSVFTGKINFNDLVFNIGNTPIKYGSFITNVVNFFIIAFSVFLMIRYINKLNKKLEESAKEINEKLEKNHIHLKKNHKGETIKEEVQEEVIPTTKICPFCLSEIPFKATRCPHCTSLLEEDKKED